ncbi:trypsin-like serine protease [Microcoleus sp. FACHB-53]|nr:trypsin-like serine protease [Microcoleus sp. FACHB-53]
MRTNKNQWILPLIAGTSCILTLTGVTQALSQPEALQVPTAPLSPNDPAAKLDPKLVNVPAMPQPGPTISTIPLSPQSPVSVSAVGYDPQTGTVQEISRQQQLSSSTAQQGGVPNLGRDPTVQQEPDKGVPVRTIGPTPSSVIGQDDRIRIDNTTTYPWRTQAKLYVTYPNGQIYGCSGTLISAKYLLTAGHCVHNPSRGGWITKMEVIPGLNGTYKPYGSVFATYFRSYTGWTKDRNKNYDFALVTLDRNIGNTTGWLGYNYYSSINGVTGNIAGYPGDKGSVYLYYDAGSIGSSTSQRLHYQIDTNSGQSGSGIYRIINNDRYVFGVHTDGNEGSCKPNNCGTRIDSNKLKDLNAWIATGN